MDKQEIIHILYNTPQKEWSIQGFGFMRCYLENESSRSTRLHIWDKRLAYYQGSRIHTHPWRFLSKVLSGVLVNKRYSLGAIGSRYYTHSRSILKAGEGAYLKGEPEKVILHALEPEVCIAGTYYQQQSNEIHESIIVQNGTITLVERVVDTADADLAYTFWERGEDWVNQQPRPATGEEIAWVTANARKLLEVE